MTDTEPTDEQLLMLGRILHRYMLSVYGKGTDARKPVGGHEFAVWGNFGTAEDPARHLTLDGKVDITRDESGLLDALGYNDSFGNPHE